MSERRDVRKRLKEVAESLSSSGLIFGFVQIKETQNDVRVSTGFWFRVSS